MSKATQDLLQLWRRDGSPELIRCYDNRGRSLDRYTVVFHGRYQHRTNGSFVYLTMSGKPSHPQGLCSYDEASVPIDRPLSGHLGRRISFYRLPIDARRVVLLDYAELWNVDLPRSPWTQKLPIAYEARRDGQVDEKLSHFSTRATAAVATASLSRFWQAHGYRTCRIPT